MDVPVIAVEFDMDDEGSSFTLEELRDAFESVPEPYRAKAVLFVRAGGDYPTLYGEVRYARPETAEEEQRRLERERELEKQRRAFKESCERKEYERLKRKYG